MHLILIALYPLPQFSAARSETLNKFDSNRAVIKPGRSKLSTLQEFTAESSLSTLNGEKQIKIKK